MKLIPIIKKINSIERDISENQTLISVVLPLFQYLGWDIFNENIVIYEDTTSTKKRVDITFHNKDSSFLIEVKRFSHKLTMKDFEQLTLYINSDDNINFGLLTNGSDYWLADNRKEGLEKKKIHELNLFQLTDCDLNILKKFFFFASRYSLEDINRYIEYINMGIQFGDKECRKVLETSSFENEIREKPKVEKKREEKKPKIEETPEVEEKLQVEEVEEKPKVEEVEEKPKVEEAEEKPKIEKVEEKPKEKSSDDFQIKAIRSKKEGEVKEFFEFLDRSQAKIYLNGEYHILGAQDFPALSIKILRYIFQEIQPFPSLYQRSIENFDFITKEGERNIQSAKYDQIADSLYFNSNINNVSKLKNIESLLKFIASNFE